MKYKKYLSEARYPKLINLNYYVVIFLPEFNYPLHIKFHQHKKVLFSYTASRIKEYQFE